MKGEATVATILVIDDDRAVLATVDLVLKRRGHEIVIAETARKGLRLLEEQPFDLVIVDIFMPEMDGLETIRRVQLVRPTLPVIVMSGYQFAVSTAPRPDFLHMAKQLGAYASIKKPFRPGELLQMIDNCLESRQGAGATRNATELS
jgi:DNA-binding NtrC family response regulator